MSLLSQNRLLALLPERDATGLQEQCQVLDLQVGNFLERAGETVERVYFPTDGVISIVAEYAAGEIVEMATVGREGFAGLVPFLGGREATASCLVQVKGAAISLSTADFRSAIKASEALQHICSTYAQAFLNQLMVSVACNSRHSVSQRLARWLLMMCERTDQPDLRFTHEFLAELLAVRRASVTDALRELRAKGAVSSSRGLVRVDDHKALIAESCECHRLTQQVYAQLLPASDR